MGSIWSEWQQFLKGYWKAKSSPPSTDLEIKAWTAGGMLKRWRSSGNIQGWEGMRRGNRDMDTKRKGRLKTAHRDKEQSPLHRRESPKGLWSTPRGQAWITLDVLPLKKGKSAQKHTGSNQASCRLERSPTPDTYSPHGLCSSSPLVPWQGGITQYCIGWIQMHHIRVTKEKHWLTVTTPCHTHPFSFSLGEGKRTHQYRN